MESFIMPGWHNLKQCLSNKDCVGWLPVMYTECFNERHAFLYDLVPFLWCCWLCRDNLLPSGFLQQAPGWTAAYQSSPWCLRPPEPFAYDQTAHVPNILCPLEVDLAERVLNADAVDALGISGCAVALDGHVQPVVWARCAIAQCTGGGPDTQERTTTQLEIL